MPKPAKNHMQNRFKVCILCMRKAPHIISKLVAGQLRLQVQGLENYDPEDPKLPQGICNTCRANLAKITNGKKTRRVCQIF